MRIKTLCAAAAGLVWAGSAAAVAPDEFDIPYVGASYLHEFSDSQRESDDGQGFSVFAGMSLADYGYSHWAAEVTFHDLGRERNVDGNKDYQRGLMLDLVYDFGTFGWGENAQAGPAFKPFVLGGIGAVQEDVRGEKGEYFGANLGAGLLFPLKWWGSAIRLETRVLTQVNDETVPEEDLLIDYRVGLGLQVPLTPFFTPSESAVAPAQECEVAVVDPSTGRTDCGTDSDRDSVADGRDECPMTPSGTPVDARGCPVDTGSDEDADGVANDDDACMATYRGLSVDAKGCVVDQVSVLPGVNFDYDAASLTGEAKGVLDALSRTFKNQAGLSSEIVGHTDAKGTDAYNITLSEQRAQSVRQYLIGHGVDADRLSASGAGKTQPRFDNANDGGRAQNRRVEFKLDAQ